MKQIVRLVIAASALLLSGQSAAQTFKCTDAAGRITYSDRQCNEVGLKDAGEVTDRLNVSPAYQAPASTSESSRSDAPPPAAAPSPETPAAESPAPQRRCFVVHTPNGNVTRCNDTPPEQ